MTPKTISFDQKTNPFVLNDHWIRSFGAPASTKFKIHLLEMKVDNPSRFTIILRGNGKSVTIPLFRLRTKFIHENGLFILDTSTLPYFTIDASTNDFEIEVAPKDANFGVTIYGFTDQTLFDNINYAH